MKFRLLYLLASIFATISLVQCTDSVTGETKKIKSNQATKYDDKNLSAPIQISPDDGANDVSLKPTFKWEAVEGADSYILHASAEDQMVIEEQVTENTYTPANELFPKANQSWRVRAVKNGKRGRWSEIQIFSTEASTNNDKPSGNTNGSVSSDRAALMDLYEATGGEHWDNNSGWGEGEPSNEWYGIKTNGQGRVIRVDLWKNNLKGQLPESVGNLDKVTYLNVKNNKLTGEIPSSIGDMASLEWLVLQGYNSQTKPLRFKEPPEDIYHSYHRGKRLANTNDFHGTIPSSIGDLSNLKRLEIAQGPNIVGPIPSEIGQLSNLEGLYLSWNDFSGTTLPSSLGNLTNLRHLMIASAGLEGELPSSLENLTKLTVIHFGGSDPRNYLTGEIPDFSQFTELRVVIMSKNNLTGTYPSYWNNGNFTYLRTIGFAWNDLTGTLHGFDNLPYITSFLMSGNNLTGDIDALTTVPARIQIISIGWNNLSGDFPQNGWPDFYQLKTTFFSANSLTGDIPCSFWQKLDNPKLNIAKFGGNNFNDVCSSGAKAMSGEGSIDLGL